MSFGIPFCLDGSIRPLLEAAISGGSEPFPRRLPSPRNPEAADVAGRFEALLRFAALQLVSRV
jgi:hypothetical protein